MSIVIIPVKYVESSKQKSKVGEKTTAAGEVVRHIYNNRSSLKVTEPSKEFCEIRQEEEQYLDSMVFHKHLPS